MAFTPLTSKALKSNSSGYQPLGSSALKGGGYKPMIAPTVTPTVQQPQPVVQPQGNPIANYFKGFLTRGTQNPSHGKLSPKGSTPDFFSALGRALLSSIAGVANTGEANTPKNLTPTQVNQYERGVKSNFTTQGKTNVATQAGAGVGGMTPYFVPYVGTFVAANQLLSSRTPTQVAGGVVNLLLAGGVGEAGLNKALENVTLVKNLAKANILGVTADDIAKIGLEKFKTPLPENASAFLRAIRPLSLTKSATEGAIFGGAGAVSEGETNPKEVAKAAGQGALAGLVLGPTMGAAKDVVKGFTPSKVSSFLDNLRNRPKVSPEVKDAQAEATAAKIKAQTNLNPQKQEVLDNIAAKKERQLVQLKEKAAEPAPVENANVKPIGAGNVGGIEPKFANRALSFSPTDKVTAMTPEEVMPSKTSLFHGTAAKNINSIITSGEISPKISKFDKAGELTVSLSPNHNIAATQGGDIVFEVPKELVATREAPNGVVKGVDTAGFEVRSDKPIPLSNVKKVYVVMGKNESPSDISYHNVSSIDHFGNTKLTAGDTYQQVADKLKAKGLDVSLVNESPNIGGAGNGGGIEPKIEPTAEKPPETVKVSESKLPVGTGETKVSKLYDRYVKMLDNVPQNERDSLEYKVMNRKTQVKSAMEQLTSGKVSVDEAIDIITGKKPAPKGLDENAFTVALHQMGADNTDIAMKVASAAATRKGQSLSLLAEIDKDNPVSYLTSITKSRLEAAGGEAKVKIARAETEKQLQAAINKKMPTVSDWHNFIQNMECK